MTPLAAPILHVRVVVHDSSPCSLLVKTNLGRAWPKQVFAQSGYRRRHLGVNHFFFPPCAPTCFASNSGCCCMSFFFCFWRLRSECNRLSRDGGFVIRRKSS